MSRYEGSWLIQELSYWHSTTLQGFCLHNVNDKILHPAGWRLFWSFLSKREKEKLAAFQEKKLKTGSGSFTKNKKSAVNYKCYLEEGASTEVGAFFTGPQREQTCTFQNAEDLNSPSADSITLPSPPTRDSRLFLWLLLRYQVKFKYGLFSGTQA